MLGHCRSKGRGLLGIGAGYTGLALLWIFVSWCLNQTEKGGAILFDLQPVCWVKGLCVVLTFTGRFCLFPGHRLHYTPRIRKMIWFLLFCCLGSCQNRQIMHGFFILLGCVDAGLWAFFLTSWGEVWVALFYDWSILPRESGPIQELWEHFWKESLDYAIWMAIAFGLVYYYLISFYLIDGVFYSWLFVMVLSGSGLLLYQAAYCRITEGLREKIYAIDRRLQNEPLWEERGESPQLINIEPGYLSMITVRAYYHMLCRPEFSFWGIGGYLLGAAFLLGLSEWVGMAVPVGLGR